MINADLLSLLQQCGASDQNVPVQSRIASAFSTFIDTGSAEAEAIEALALGLETALTKHAKSSILLAKLCAHLQQLTGGMKPTRLAVILAGAAPDLVKSLSWMTKLVKAGDILLRWPQLEDVSNVDKLATLRRIPKKLQREIFESGRLPDGADFRVLGRVELSEAINCLRAGGRATVPPNPYRDARQKLIKLVADLGPICESFAGLSGYSATVEQLREMQRRFVKLVDETAVTPRALGGRYSRDVCLVD